MDAALVDGGAVVRGGEKAVFDVAEACEFGSGVAFFDDVDDRNQDDCSEDVRDGVLMLGGAGVMLGHGEKGDVQKVAQESKGGVKVGAFLLLRCAAKLEFEVWAFGGKVVAKDFPMLGRERAGGGECERCVDGMHTKVSGKFVAGRGYWGGRLAGWQRFCAK